MPLNPLQSGLRAIRNLFGARPAVSDPASHVKVAPGESVTTMEPKLVVAGLPPGTYTFTVSATDEKGVVSETSTCVIEVQ